MNTDGLSLIWRDSLSFFSHWTFFNVILTWFFVHINMDGISLTRSFSLHGSLLDVKSGFWRINFVYAACVFVAVSQENLYLRLSVQWKWRVKISLCDSTFWEERSVGSQRSDADSELRAMIRMCGCENSSEPSMAEYNIKFFLLTGLNSSIGIVFLTPIHLNSLILKQPSKLLLQLLLQCPFQWLLAILQES